MADLSRCGTSADSQGAAKWITSRTESITTAFIKAVASQSNPINLNGLVVLMGSARHRYHGVKQTIAIARVSSPAIKPVSWAFNPDDA